MGELDAWGEGREDDEVRQPDRRVQQEQRPVGVGALEPEAGEERDAPREERAGRLRKVAEQAVQRERPRPPLKRHRLGQDRLVDRVEDADLRARRADRSGESGQDKEPRFAREREEQPPGGHEQGHGHDRATAPVSVGRERPDHGHRRTARDGRRDHEPDHERRQAEVREVQADHDREVAVPERPQHPRQEQASAVGADPAEPPCRHGAPSWAWPAFRCRIAVPGIVRAGVMPPP